MPIKFANNAETTLSSAVSTSATSIPVVDASVFPSITGSDYFLVTLVDSGDNTEIVKVTAVSSNTLTVSRAREGTTARSYQSGDKVENRLTAGGLADLNTRTDVDVDTMTGDGSSTTLTLSTAPASEDNTQVYLDGVYQNKSTYSVSGTTLTFSTAPPSGVAVEVIIITPAAGTFSSSDYATSTQGSKADNALPRSGGAMTGAITTNSTFDGRDVATDGAKLDTIATNADVTNTASVTASGALMDSEVDADIKTLSLPANTTISNFGKSLIDDADAVAARTTLGVDAAGTVNYTHPAHDGDDIDIDTTPLSGATVISDLDLNVTTDTLGHVTDANATVATRNLTLADLGYTGETNATADQSNLEIETAYNAQVAQVSASEKTAGTVTAVRRFSPADIANMAAVHDTLPIGSFILWGSNTIPSNYLLVNQASLSRTTYSALFNVIGTAFGAADSSHFNLPPRGVFIRITAGGSANDPDRANRTASATGGNTGDNVGSFQADNVGYHRHIGGMKRIHDSADGEYGTISNQGAQHQTLSRFEPFPTPTPNYDLDYTSYSGSDDTRPTNVNFNLIVKYAA